MFEDSNILLFILCLIPVVLYSITLFANSPSFSIRFKTSFTYLYTGLLSVTLLQFIFFIFPHLHDIFFKVNIGNFNLLEGYFEIYQPTFASLLFYAFIQVALMEETCKWIAFKSTDYMRGKRRKNLDHPYAIMFYSTLVSAAFSIVENIQYAQRAMHGEFGAITAESLLITRAVSSVIVHMACGLFMGYYIARGKGASFTRRLLFNLIGIFAATFIHGIYDMNWMKPGTEKDYYEIFSGFPIHISSAIIIGFSFIIAFLMSWHLRHINKENKKIIEQ